MTVTVRAAVPADRDFVVALVPRLSAFGTSPLRPADTIDAAEAATLDRALADLPEDATLLVAELPGEGAAGLAYAETGVDYFTGERHGHLALLIVAGSGEGRGVGRALLAAIERWSASRGHRFLTLNVFAGNARARAVYERAGFAPDTVRYAKPLAPATP
jgi:GNAT superfamily N-acetyltransferase